MGQKKLPALAQVLQRLVLLRLFLPLVALSVIAIGGVGYLGKQTLESQQQRQAQFMARIVERYLDQAARTLDAVARVAEASPPQDLATFMQGTWEAYGYFDTLYYLDANSKITMLAPPDPRYLGLDMSNLPYFQQAEEKKKPFISRPFISLRTGNPTVYLVRQLARGGQVVGALSLGSLQDEITHGRGAPGQGVIFIMDQSGMLLAHPTANLVKQQTNQSYLEIFRRGLSRDATLVYEYAGTMVLGSAAQVERAGWVVVDQIPLSALLGPYTWALGLTLLASLFTWLALAWSLRRQLERHVALPLRQLSRGTGALANGDFSQGRALAAIPAAFAELTTLATDFQNMSDALQARQVALQESEERYRLVFENSPVSIWEEDFSGVRSLFDNLRNEGITDIEIYFAQHPETVPECANLTRLVDVNRASLSLHGAATKEELLAGLVNVFTPESFDAFRRELVCLWNGGTEMISDTVVKTLAGEPRHVTVHFSVSPGYEETLAKVLVSLTDITERKQAEESLRRLNRELRAISDCNQTLLRAVDEQTLLNDICRIVCDEAGYRMAWVGYAEHDEAKTVRPVAWAGVEDGYLASANITWADRDRGRGPTGTAIRSGESACLQDFTTEPQAIPWRETAMQRGYHSNIALPLKDESARTFGALTIYSTEPNAFTPAEIRLLEELAGDLAFGITILRIRAEHKKTEIQLQASEQLFRTLVENSPDFIVRYDRQYRRIYVNPALQKLFGKPAEAMLNQTPADESPLHAPQVYLEQLRQVVETATERTVEMQLGTTHGEIDWGHVRFVPEFGPDGQVASVLTIGRTINEVKEKERRFRTLAENFPDFVIRFDRDGQFVYVNPAVEKAFGLPAEAFIGKTLQELPQLHRLERFDTLMVLFRRVFEEGVANNSEIHWNTQMGQRIFEIRLVPEKDAAGNVVTVLSIAHDITERKQAEQERLAHLRYMENMDRINRAIQGANDLEQVMRDVLDLVLSIFEGDRAFLLYPCDPEAAIWRVPMERTKPEYPGVLALGLEMPMTANVVETFHILLAAEGPVKFGPETPNPLPTDMSERFGFKSLISMALYPKVGMPWQFGIHQCSYARIWTTEEERLFQEMGRRLTDALTGLLAYRHLEESEERYRLIAENTADTISVFDLNFKLIYVSPSVLKLRGYTVEEAMTQSLHQILMPESLQIANRVMAEQMALEATGTADPARTVLLELEEYCKDGATIWVELTASFLRDNQLKPTGILTVTRDITERKRSEEALQESEDRYRRLVELSPDSISIHSQNRIVFVNSTTVRLSGAKEPEELLGRSVLESIHPDSRETVKQRIVHMLATGEPTQFVEEKFLRVDGSTIDVEVAAVPFRYQGAPAIQIVARDITERKKAEQALRESEERLRQIASSLREVIWLRDVQTRQVLYVNPAFETLTGRACESFYENRDIVMDAIHPDDKEWMIKALEQRFESVPFNKEHRIIHLDGSVRWVWSRIFPVRNEAGEVYRSASIMEDITERKWAEEEIRQLNQELEQRVLDRTAQLEIANKELEAFAYSVSHDLRAPLRHINGFMEMLQQRTVGTLDERSWHYMTTIADSAIRMGQLIDDLLSFSRLGRNEMSKRPVNLADLVQEVIRQLEPEIQDRPISWHIADLPIVSGDRAMLRLVLTNLLSNALKFTRGRSQAKIEIGCQPGQGSETIFFVRDNGAGFDMNYAEKLFGVFQRLHRADEFEGTGIGLANVRRIIQRHGGRTWAEGKVDQGATFFFSLPQFIQGA